MRTAFTPIILAMFLYACTNQEQKIKVNYPGKVFGTFYSVIYYDKDTSVYQYQIDSVLKELDHSLSIYNPNSVISKINQGDTGAYTIDNYFMDVMTKALEISSQTNHAFDITVGLLVNAWGFGFENKAKIDSVLIDSLLKGIGTKNIELKENKLIKKNKHTILDFNAIAKGYGVDVIGEFLKDYGINDYLIEIGGEVVAKGKKPGNKAWKIGIEEPAPSSADARELNSVIELRNMAVATSGNYRNYYIENGQRYAHTLDPRTGYPAKNKLLSATVFANTCLEADAYATAFMVMGFDESKKFLKKNPQLEGFLIYSGQGNTYETYSTPKIENSIQRVK